MNKPYAVVYFINDNNYSEIPSNWLLKDQCTGKVSHCKWPPQQGSLNLRMKNKITPAEDWLIYDVEVIKYCDTLKYARKAAEDSQCSSETDRPLGRGFRKKRPSAVATAFKESNDLESSDNSDDNDKTLKLAAPFPKYDKSKEHPTRITEAHALGPKKHKEKATEISDTEESNGVLTDKELVSSRKNGKSGGILPDNSIRTTSKAESMNIDEKITEHPRSIIPDDFDHENDDERFNTLDRKLDQCLYLLGAHSIKLKDIEQRLLTINSANPEVNNNDTVSSEIKEDLPLNSKEEISAFEEKLLSKKYSQEFVKIVKQVGGSNAKDCTERVLNLIFSQKFAATNTWEGKNTKYKVADLKLMKMCEGAILDRYPSWDSAQFSQASQNWFRLGNQRAGQQPKQVQKKTKPPASEENED